jgi:hypothetical protein
LWPESWKSYYGFIDEKMVRLNIRRLKLPHSALMLLDSCLDIPGDEFSAYVLIVLESGGRKGFVEQSKI